MRNDTYAKPTATTSTTSKKPSVLGRSSDACRRIHIPYVRKKIALGTSSPNATKTTSAPTIPRRPTTTNVSATRTRPMERTRQNRATPASISLASLVARKNR